jgi:hypothetical protein
MGTGVYKSLKLTLGTAVLATACFAAGSVASVTSAQPLSVDGVTLANPGVASWPLISNDEVATTSGGALMTFRDGSAIQLAPQSKVKVMGTPAAPEVVLLAGNLDTKLAPGSRLLVMRANATKDDADRDDVSYSGVGGPRQNNNTPFRKAALLYFGAGVSLAGLGIAVDAILQPTAASAR